MPSAIARMYCGGFAVAADGRMTNPDHVPIDDQIQKIFCVDEPQIKAACTLAGIAEIASDETGDIVFEFLKETPKAIAVLKGERFASLWNYAEALAVHLTKLVNATNETAGASEQAGTHIYLDGYFRKRPKSAHV